MQLTVLGSSSKGNGYLLTTARHALILECGVPLALVKRALNFDMSKLVGAFVTHSHNDHAGRVSEYMAAGIKVFASAETQKETKILSHKWQTLKAGEITHVPGFRFLPFSLKHDVACLGFYVQCDDGNTFCFITDTHYCEYTFNGLTNVIIECNYDEAIIDNRLENNQTPINVYNRVQRSHVGFDTCMKFLRANDLTKVNNIVLVHLSAGNSDAQAFKNKIENSFGKPVHIAEPGLIIDFNKTPF